MLKFKLFSDSSDIVLKHFLNEADPITTIQLQTIMNTLKKRKLFQQPFLLVNDENTVIAIIDPSKLTLYIYSNCGLNFDYELFFNTVLRYKRFISAITCSRLLYQKLKKTFIKHKLLLEKTDEIYTMNLNEISKIDHTIEYTTSKHSISQSHLSYLIYNDLYKIIDRHHILFIYNQYVGLIYVEDTCEFTDLFFEINEEYNESLSGYLVTYIDPNNKNIIKYSDSFMLFKFNDGLWKIISTYLTQPISLQHEITLTFSTLKIQDGLLYYYDSQHVNHNNLKNIGFINNQTKIYACFEHENINKLQRMPEIRENFFVEKYRYATVFTFIIMFFYVFISSLLLLSTSFKVFSIIYFISSFPFIFIYPKKVFYLSKFYKTKIFNINYLALSIIIFNYVLKIFNL